MTHSLHHIIFGGHVCTSDGAFDCPEAKQQLPLGQIAYIPGENAALQGLGQVNRDLIAELGRRCPDQKIATVDQDATIIESHKREALCTYEGERGYQPMLAVWAETDLVLADEFRDGNVTAMQEPLAVAKAAWCAGRGMGFFFVHLSVPGSYS